MSDDVTTHLLRLQQGDDAAMERVLPAVYAELHAIAAREMRKEGVGHTLQTTALVHEAYMRLMKKNNLKWQNRSHFLAVASKTMRYILVDHARRKRRLKRGGGAEHVPLDDVIVATDPSSTVDVLALDEALTRLAENHPRAAQVVELCYFGDLTQHEAADVLGVKRRTISRDWDFARAWLLTVITGAAIDLPGADER